MGRDITIDLVSTLSMRSLVGKMELVKLSREDLLEWVRVQWKPFIQNIPRVLSLVNGWFIFHFMSEEDSKAVEERFWVHGKGSLVLSRWNVHFDPRTKDLEKRHFYVVLPGFALFS